MCVCVKQKINVFISFKLIFVDSAINWRINGFTKNSVLKLYEGPHFFAVISSVFTIAQRILKFSVNDQNVTAFFLKNRI